MCDINRELKKTLMSERALYLPDVKTLKSKIVTRYVHNEQYEIYRFICALRKAEFYQGRNKLLHLYYLRKSNIRGKRLGYAITPGTLGKGVYLSHKNIIINHASRIGDGCVLHGLNCLGINGDDNDNGCPVLGRNVDVGAGATILGPVILADGIRVGSNAVVVKSFTEPGITIAGVPAVKVKPRTKEHDINGGAV